MQCSGWCVHPSGAAAQTSEGCPVSVVMLLGTWEGGTGQIHVSGSRLDVVVGATDIGTGVSVGVCACEGRVGVRKPEGTVDLRWMPKHLHEGQLSVRPAQDRAHYPSGDSAGFCGDPCLSCLMQAGS